MPLSQIAEFLREEADLLAEADRRAADYLRSVNTKRVFPDHAALADLKRFDEPFPENGLGALNSLVKLDRFGAPASVTTNGPNYFGFVVGACLPAAAAADRLLLAWDQCASSFDNSPIADKLERVAAGWILEALDLPRQAGVGFGTSATASNLACLAAARRSLLKRQGWDLDQDGVFGAPEIKVVISELGHVSVKKALRILGFGSKRLILAPCDAAGRIDEARLPPLDAHTIVCLQAGEVNSGEFDPFAPIIARAKAAGAWVHVDGAFGLWARASHALAPLAAGVEGADSWALDSHKWLNTPYDGACAICADRDALSGALNADAVYAQASPSSQKNLTLEFSRRARGVAIWAVLRSLGRDGLSAMIERHVALAQYLAAGLRAAGLEILNRVVINQVLVRAYSDEETIRIRQAAIDTGQTWFGATQWQGRPAFRLSISSWRTQKPDVDALLALLTRIACDPHLPSAGT